MKWKNALQEVKQSGLNAWTAVVEIMQRYACAMPQNVPCGGIEWAVKN